jgi:hypothetical protein
MLVALYNIQVDELVGERETLVGQRRRRNFIGWTLAVLALGERAAIVVAPSHSLYLVGTLGWFLLFSYITWNELRAVILQKEVTRETISMSISVYLLIGITYGLLYFVLYQLQPGAFSFGGSPVAISSAEDLQRILPVLIYFSLTTLSTIGFGDITPTTLRSRYAAVSEGITGQFYLAILVARLVGIYMSRSATPRSANSPNATVAKGSAGARNPT